MSEQTSTAEVARRIGVTPATLRRWQKAGVIPQAGGNGAWTPAAFAQARIVARLRDRGHSLQAIREATESGRLAFGYIEDLLSEPAGEVSLADAAAETGL